MGFASDVRRSTPRPALMRCPHCDPEYSTSIADEMCPSLHSMFTPTIQCTRPAELPLVTLDSRPKRGAHRLEEGLAVCTYGLAQHPSNENLPVSSS